MNEFQKIKEKIYEEDRLVDLLYSIGCDYVKLEQGGNLVTASLPIGFNSNNKRAVQVRNNKYLTCNIRNRMEFYSDAESEDIFSLVSYLKFELKSKDYKSNIHYSKDFIIEALNFSDDVFEKNTSKDYLKKIKGLVKSCDKEFEIKYNGVLDEEIMNEFWYKNYPLPNQKWIDEGIPYNIQCLYGVGFDSFTRRIVFPIKNLKGEIVGVKGRIFDNNDIGSDKKYIYLYRCDNGKEWFNYHIAHKYILEEKKVYIFESEKSVMKAVAMGYYNCLSIGASDITLQQIELLRRLGNDIEIVLCYDKDKTIDEIENQGRKLKNDEISMMYDMDNIIVGKKDAPVDNGIKVWKKLLKNNIYSIDKNKK